jgi:hypothetical protein
LPATSAASSAPASRPLAASIERCMFAWIEPVPYARPGDVGGSLSALIVIVKVCVGLSLTPPLAVPPSSVASSVIVAVPFWFKPAVKERVPFAATVGPAEKRPGFVLFVTTKEGVWPDSFAGPTLIPVAQPVVVWAPESSSNV